LVPAGVVLTVPAERPLVDRVEERLDQFQISHDTTITQYQC
jgi:hypothetical protein